MSATKHVSVTVDSSHNVICTPDTVEITVQNTLVVFDLNTDGYHFPDTNAIVVTTSNTDFPYASWTVKPQVCGIFDHKLVNGSYKYTATVVEDATGTVYFVDPIIKNGNPGS